MAMRPAVGGTVSHRTQDCRLLLVATGPAPVDSHCEGSGRGNRLRPRGLLPPFFQRGRNDSSRVGAWSRSAQGRPVSPFSKGGYRGIFLSFRGSGLETRCNCG